MNFTTFQKQPKAEIHVHLEGAMFAQRVCDWVAERPDNPWFGANPEQLASQFQMATFPEFIQAFMTGYRLLDSANRFQQITEDLCSSFEEQGVVYAEVLYSPGVQIQFHGQPLKNIHDGIARGLAQFPNLKVRFILDTVLNLGLEFMTRTLEAVLGDRREFLAGFSVGGGVPDLKIQPFLPLFEKAQQAGLFCVAHAGEVDGSENIEALVKHTDIQRIAHGCSAAKDPAVLALLKQHQITVDVCPTSNSFTGASAGFHPHPAVTFIQNGIPITLNTDDPLYFGCNLFGEYQVAMKDFGIDENKALQIMAHGLSFAERNNAL